MTERLSKREQGFLLGLISDKAGDGAWIQWLRDPSKGKIAKVYDRIRSMTGEERRAMIVQLSQVVADTRSDDPCDDPDGDGTECDAFQISLDNLSPPGAKRLRLYLQSLQRNLKRRSHGCE